MKTEVVFFGETYYKQLQACQKQSVCYYRNASSNL